MILANRFVGVPNLRTAVEFLRTETEPCVITPLAPERCQHKLFPVTAGVVDFNVVTDTTRPLHPDTTPAPPPLQPADGFAQQDSGWWTNRAVRSDIVDPADMAIHNLVNRLVRAGVTREQVLANAYALPPPRSGVKKLFSLMAHRCVIDKGPVDVIATYLKANGITSKIAGTELRYTDDGKVTDYIADTPPVGERGFKAIRDFLKENAISAPETLLAYGPEFDATILSLGMPTINMLVVGRATLEEQARHLGNLWARTTLLVTDDALDWFATEMSHSRLKLYP